MTVRVTRVRPLVKLSIVVAITSATTAAANSSQPVMVMPSEPASPVRRCTAWSGSARLPRTGSEVSSCRIRSFDAVWKEAVVVAAFGACAGGSSWHGAATWLPARR
jgi:hypothetical protein